MAVYYGNSPQNANYRGRVEITEIIPHPETNTSSITWNFKVYRADGYSSSYNRSSGNVISFYVDGSRVTPTGTASSVNMANATSESSAVTLAYGQFDVAHDVSGQKSFSFSATYYNTNSSTIGSASAPLTVSGTFTCQTIALASVVTPNVSEVQIAEGEDRQVYLSMPKTNSSYTHTLGWRFNGSTMTYFANGVGEGYVWTLPDFNTLVSLCTNAKYGDLVIQCITMNGETMVGYTENTIQIDIPAYVVNMTVTDAAVGTHAEIGYIQKVNKCRLTFNSVGKWGASLARVYVNGYEVGTTSYEFDLDYAGTHTITVAVEDTRGFTNSGEVTITVLPYEKPTFGDIKVYRCDSDGTANPSGNNAYVEASVTISSVDGYNAIQRVYSEYRTPDSTYGGDQFIFTYDAVTGTYKGIVGDGNLASTAKYYIAIVAIDKFDSFGTERLLPEESVSIYEKVGNAGIGLGCYLGSAETGVKIKPEWPIKHGTHTIDAIVDISLNPENGYVVYESGFKVAWKKVTLTNLAITTKMGSLYRNSSASSLGDFPITFVAPPTISTQWRSDANIAWVSDIVGASNTSWGSAFIFAAESGNVSGTVFLIAVGR